jgi:hypothetical protein
LRQDTFDLRCTAQRINALYGIRFDGKRVRGRSLLSLADKSMAGNVSMRDGTYLANLCDKRSLIIFIAGAFN